MSGPVAKSLRGKKKKKDGGNLPAGNERKIEQVGKLSLPRQTLFVGNRACCGSFRENVTSFTNQRSPVEATRCGGPFIRRGRVAKSILAGKQQDRSIARRN